MGKFNGAALAALLLVGAAAPATAAVVPLVPLTDSSSSFQNPSVRCTPEVTSCPDGQAFSDTVTFTTPTGFNSVSAILNSTFNTTNPLTNLNFSSVTLNNGTGDFAFNVVNGVFDSASAELVALNAGATNVLTINGTTFGDASYSGTLSFGMNSAVPEPATWALMLLGFGAVGWSMRRRERTTALPQLA